MVREFQEQLQQAQDQLQQAQKQLRQAQEQLEDKRIKRWENEGSADGEHVLNTRERSRSLGWLSPPIQHPTDADGEHVGRYSKDARLRQEHGLDHPAVVIDFPSLEYACDYSNTSYISSDRERGGDASSRGGTCRAGDQVSWIFSVRGLVPGFLYRLHFEWSLEDEQQGALDLNISTTTSSYAVRTPLAESGQNGTSIFDLIAHSRKLRMDVAVWDVYPGLTEEDALIGARHMDSAVNTVRVLCTDSDSGERTKVPDGEGDEWQYDVSAATEDVCISHSTPHSRRLRGIARDTSNSTAGNSADLWQRNDSAWAAALMQFYNEANYNVHRLNLLGWHLHAYDADAGAPD